MYFEEYIIPSQIPITPRTTVTIPFIVGLDSLIMRANKITPIILTTNGITKPAVRKCVAAAYQAETFIFMIGVYNIFMKNTSFHDFVIYDLMANLPEISSKRMMSGWCIYSRDIPIGAIIEDQLYFKADGEMADKLKSLGSEQFEYEKTNHKVIKMRYWSVPEDFVDDQDKFDELAYEVIDVLKK